ncbi:MAG: GAF domain-containing protein [Chloroflexi bacterium]|nr:MAG: GAF domain-containing protein [Chloroflexota bacterium]
MPEHTEETHPASPPQKSSIIDDIFDLTAAKSMAEMLEKAVQMTVRILGADAGSLFFAEPSPRQFRAGIFRPEAQRRIEGWEKTIRKRLEGSSWIITRDPEKAVSVSTLENSKITLLSTPLLQQTKVVGLLSVALPPERPPTDNYRALLAKIAGGVGQIAALFAEIELGNHRVHQLSVFYDVGQALVTTFDINKLLLDTMELAANLIDAGASSIMLVDEEKKELVFRVSHGARAEMVRQQRIPIDEGIAGWVASNGRPVIANDARTDDRFSHRVDVRTGFLTQSIAAVPLKVKGKIIGVLELLNKYSGQGFTQDDVQLMSFIATQAAIAIENARLYNQLREERDKILKGQETAYRNISSSLHDGTLQYLSAIRLGLDHIYNLSRKASPEVMQNQIAALRNLVNQATRNARSLLFEFHPPILETRGLVSACRYYIEQLRQYSACEIHLSTVDDINYGPTVSGTICAIMQEAIDNVMRHANANNVWVSLAVENGQFIATVRDDGQGFKLEQVGQQPGHQPALGIVNMKSQAAAINGELDITSSTEQPRRGTTVRLTMPAPAQPVEE